MYAPAALVLPCGLSGKECWAAGAVSAVVCDGEDDRGYASGLALMLGFDGFVLRNPAGRCLDTSGKPAALALVPAATPASPSHPQVISVPPPGP